MILESHISKYPPATSHVLKDSINSIGLDTRLFFVNNEPSYYTLKKNQELYERLKILENIHIPHINNVEVAKLCLEEYWNPEKCSKYCMSLTNGGLFKEWGNYDY
jgi:hypothetical protein